MNKYFIVLVILLSGCFGSQRIKSSISNNDFRGIILSYMDEYPMISNKCNGSPYYKVYFNSQDTVIGFWIAAHLGQPGNVPPIHPDSTLPANNIEIKGLTTLNKQPLVIYDYKDSHGYGLYNPQRLSLKKMEKIKAIPEDCSHVWHPEAWFFTITEDSIYISDTREPYKPQ